MYYIFFDESGSFDNDNDNSIVGGLITKKSSKAIGLEFPEICSTINKIWKTDFNLKDIHIAPLLHPENTGSDTEKIRFNKINIDARDAFAEACKEKVISFAEKVVISCNKGSLIGIDSQSRYGANLLSAVKLALDYLKDKDNKENVEIMISRRSKQNIPSGETLFTYHSTLCEYVTNSFGEDYGFNIKTTWNKQYEAGCNAADVVCYYKKQNQLNDKLVLSTTVDEAMLKKYKNEKKYFIDELLNNNELAAAYNFADDEILKKTVLDKLGNIEDNKVLLRECGNLISLAYDFIDRRVVNSKGVDEAREICEAITIIAKKEFGMVEDTSLKSKWIEILVNVSNGLMVCCNHKGNTKGGKTHLQALTTLMDSHKDILGQNYEDVVLATRNRSYNAQFNNYNFSNIINYFEEVVTSRRKDIPSGKDSLTGKMMGTIGQTYAFSAGMHEKYTRDKYRKTAQKYLEESFSYFHNDSNDKDFCRGVGYLATLLWEEREYEEAVKTIALLNQYTIPEDLDMSTVTGRQSVIISWIQDVVNNEKPNSMMVFDLVTMIKIYIEESKTGAINFTKIDEIFEFAKKYRNGSHPYELLYKWIGIGYMKAEEYGKAINCFNLSMKVVKENDFTVETIGLSALGLKILAEKLNSTAENEIDFALLVDKVNDLCDKSTGFHKYIFAIGGIEKMKKDVENGDIYSIARWLPYGYA